MYSGVHFRFLLYMMVVESSFGGAGGAQGTHWIGGRLGSAFWTWIIINILKMKFLNMCRVIIEMILCDLVLSCHWVRSYCLLGQCACSLGDMLWSSRGMCCLLQWESDEGGCNTFPWNLGTYLRNCSVVTQITVSFCLNLLNILHAAFWYLTYCLSRYWAMLWIPAHSLCITVWSAWGGYLPATFWRQKHSNGADIPPSNRWTVTVVLDGEGTACIL